MAWHAKHQARGNAKDAKILSGTCRFCRIEAAHCSPGSDQGIVQKSVSSSATDK
jgi:hypothetical protein